MSSCGDDERKNDGNVIASAEVSDFGGVRLMSVDGGIDYSYNSDGTLHQVKGFGLNMTFDYKKGLMIADEEGENLEVRFTTSSRAISPASAHPVP